MIVIALYFLQGVGSFLSGVSNPSRKMTDFLANRERTVGLQGRLWFEVGFMFSAAPLSKKYSTTSSNSCGVRIVSGNWITDLEAIV